MDDTQARVARVRRAAACCLRARERHLRRGLSALCGGWDWPSPARWPDLAAAPPGASGGCRGRRFCRTAPGAMSWRRW